MSSRAEALQTTAPRVPWWRALLGLIAALGGTAALFIPMVITFAVATDFKTGTVYPPQRRPKINVKG